MSEPAKEPKPEQRTEEQKVKLYMDITGCTEASARNIVSHLEEPEEDAAQQIPGVAGTSNPP